MVALWCHVVCVTVVMSSSGCHIASCDVAPLVGVNEEVGRGVVLLTWAGHDLAAIIVIVACGGCSMVVDGLRRRCWWWWEGRSNNMATFEPWLLHLGSHVLRWGIWCFSLSCNKAFIAQLVRALLTLLLLRVHFQYGITLTMVCPWHGIIMGWFYTWGKPWAWCATYTILLHL